ncbi:MAG: Gfo/Idh/MocA family oxidoreductase [Pirellulales bacterium]|nr:Gfo/Idh/MocA family oxidoreductase [Pirellulales bacterium]
MPPRLTRRRFLYRGLAAAGSAIAAPYVLPASALGKNGATAPGDRVCMGFVGLGGQGGGHLFGGAWTYLPGGYLGRDDVQVLGVCDVQRQRAEEAKGRVGRHYAERSGQGSYAACRAYDDIRELVASPDIDAVLIAAAYHAAATNSLVALRAGKDVYCEKPTSVTIRAGRAVAETVAAYGRVYQAGTQQRSEYEGRFRRAVELARGGRIGRLQRVYAYQVGGGLAPPPSTDRGGAVPEGVNWEAYVNCLPWFNYDGNTGAHRFGWGDINWGQHHYDIAQWGAGADQTGPEEIRLDDGKPVFRYANGVEIHGCPPPGKGWDEGGATFVGTEGSVTVHRNVLVSDPPALLREAPVPNDAGVYYSDSHSGNFLECVRTRQQTICNAESTHRASSLLLLGGIAMKIGRTLKWDPVKEEFPEAPDANRLLATAAREPWRY